MPRFHKDVDLPKLLHDTADKIAARAHLSDIHGKRMCPVPQRAGGIARGRQVQVSESDGRSAFVHRGSDRQPDPPSSAGDNGGFPVQTDVHVV